MFVGPKMWIARETAVRDDGFTVFNVRMMLAWSTFEMMAQKNFPRKREDVGRHGLPRENELIFLQNNKKLNGKEKIFLQSSNPDGRNLI